MAINRLQRDEHSPSAYVAAGMGYVVVFSENEKNSCLARCITSLAVKAVGLTVFPAILLGELAVEPLFIAKDAISAMRYIDHDKKGLHISKFISGLQRLTKLVLGVLGTPGALVTGDGASYFFIQKESLYKAEFLFGMERPYKMMESLYGIQLLDRARTASGIGYLQNIMQNPDSNKGAQKKKITAQLQRICARDFKRTGYSYKVSIGSGVDFKKLLKEIGNAKSIRIEKASEVFSSEEITKASLLGWSRELNCHMANSAISLQVLDSNGGIRTLSREEDATAFKSLFNRLDVDLGIVVGATFDVKILRDYALENMQRLSKW